jgi:hypothetical protein
MLVLRIMRLRARIYDFVSLNPYLSGSLLKPSQCFFVDFCAIFPSSLLKHFYVLELHPLRFK